MSVLLKIAIGTLQAVWTCSVVETLEAVACFRVASVGIVCVNISVALAGSTRAAFFVRISEITGCALIAVRTGKSFVTLADNDRHVGSRPSVHIHVITPTHGVFLAARGCELSSRVGSIGTGTSRTLVIGGTELGVTVISIGAKLAMFALGIVNAVDANAGCRLAFIRMAIAVTFLTVRESEIAGEAFVTLSTTHARATLAHAVLSVAHLLGIDSSASVAFAG